MYRGKNMVYTHTHTHTHKVWCFLQCHTSTGDLGMYPSQIKGTITQNPAFQIDIFLTISLSHLVYFRNEKIILCFQWAKCTVFYILS